ncbi:translation initiation factor IF-2-like [Monodelphis domestica]|uniref:translation initiation factor IF-2-like n=1 Tax=Monodelphis domestica TaxID=13616 RepID=UPI0024E19885|nr:translation initiation factor IF-2-like [Monodelphis domestica]
MVMHSLNLSGPSLRPIQALKQKTINYSGGGAGWKVGGAICTPYFLRDAAVWAGLGSCHDFDSVAAGRPWQPFRHWPRNTWLGEICAPIGRGSKGEEAAGRVRGCVLGALSASLRLGLLPSSPGLGHGDPGGVATSLPLPLPLPPPLPPAAVPDPSLPTPCRGFPAVAAATSAPATAGPTPRFIPGATAGPVSSRASATTGAASAAVTAFSPRPSWRLRGATPAAYGGIRASLTPAACPIRSASPAPRAPSCSRPPAAAAASSGLRRAPAGGAPPAAGAPGRSPSTAAATAAHPPHLPASSRPAARHLPGASAPTSGAFPRGGPSPGAPSAARFP